MGMIALMKNAAKKDKNLLDLDARNRITLPQEICDGVDSFTWSHEKDGAIRLVPQQVVSLEDAKLIRMLKSSVEDFKAGRVKKIPRSWLDHDDEKL